MIEKKQNNERNDDMYRLINVWMYVKKKEKKVFGDVGKMEQKERLLLLHSNQGFLYSKQSF